MTQNNIRTSRFLCFLPETLLQDFFFFQSKQFLPLIRLVDGFSNGSIWQARDCFLCRDRMLVRSRVSNSESFLRFALWMAFRT